MAGFFDQSPIAQADLHRDTRFPAIQSGETDKRSVSVGTFLNKIFSHPGILGGFVDTTGLTLASLTDAQMIALLEQLEEGERSSSATRGHHVRFYVSAQNTRTLMLAVKRPHGFETTAIANIIYHGRGGQPFEEPWVMARISDDTGFLFLFDTYDVFVADNPIGHGGHEEFDLEFDVTQGAVGDDSGQNVPDEVTATQTYNKVTPGSAAPEGSLVVGGSFVGFGGVLRDYGGGALSPAAYANGQQVLLPEVDQHGRGTFTGASGVRIRLARTIEAIGETIEFPMKLVWHEEQLNWQTLLGWEGGEIYVHQGQFKVRFGSTTASQTATFRALNVSDITSIRITATATGFTIAFGTNERFYSAAFATDSLLPQDFSLGIAWEADAATPQGFQGTLADFTPIIYPVNATLPTHADVIDRDNYADRDHLYGNLVDAEGAQVSGLLRTNNLLGVGLPFTATAQTSVLHTLDTPINLNSYRRLVLEYTIQSRTPVPFMEVIIPRERVIVHPFDGTTITTDEAYVHINAGNAFVIGRGAGLPGVVYGNLQTGGGAHFVNVLFYASDSDHPDVVTHICFVNHATTPVGAGSNNLTGIFGLGL